jgi:hypothetical protein
VSERTFRVSFKITGEDERIEVFGAPTREWIEQQIAQPNASIFTMQDCSVEEVTE